MIKTTKFNQNSVEGRLLIAAVNMISEANANKDQEEVLSEIWQAAQKENGRALRIFSRPLTFRQEMMNLINRHSMENESNTSDFILTNYLLRCLENFATAVSARDAWDKSKNHVDAN